MDKISISYSFHEKEQVFLLLLGGMFLSNNFIFSY